MTAKLGPKEGALTWNERRSKKDRAGSMIYLARSGKRWSQVAGRRRHEPEMNCNCCHTHDEPEFDNV